MTVGAKNLKRRSYAHPNLLGMVAQVMIDWREDAFPRACDALLNLATGDSYSGTEALTNNSIIFTPSLEPANPVQHRSEFGGGVAHHRDGFDLIVEVAGIRVVASPPYRGREAVFGHVYSLLNLVKGVDNGATSPRVSVLFSSTVVPNTDPFRIEDYIAPRFEFDGDGLDFFDQFLHVVTIDLTRMAGFAAKSVVNLGSAVAGPGLSITIDVVDFRSTDLNEVPKRLEQVKDLESHVFECTITDKTREIYGVIKS